MATDPVCRMIVNEKEAFGKMEYKGRTYYFCCKSCKEKFVREPEKYLWAYKVDKEKGMYRCSGLMKGSSVSRLQTR